MSLTQLPPGERAEIIPFQAAVPPSIREVSSDLYDFLRDTTEHLRAQHLRTQVGDTTLPWENLLEVDLAPRHTPGVEGRFYHEKYGIIRGRYVRFARMDSAVTGGPVGLLTGESGLSWVVTNQIQQTVDEVPRGVIAAFVVPAEKSYGWIITQGINLSQIAVSAKAKDYLTWEHAGAIKAMGDGRPFAQVLIPGDTITAAGCLIDTQGLAGSGYGQGGSIAGAPFDFGTQILELRQRLELLDGENRLGIEYLQRRVSVLTKDRASIELTEQLSAFANFANISETASQNAGRDAKLTYVNLLATNEFTRKAAVYRTEAGYFAESSTYFANEATVQSNLAETRAIAAETSSASASDSAAEAKRSAELAAGFSGSGSTGSTLVNSNANFSDWPDGQIWPSHWYAPVGDVSGFDVVRVAGTVARWAMQQYCPQTSDRFLAASSTPAFDGFSNPGMTGLKNGWYVIYADIELEAGDLQGAGLYLAGYDINMVLAQRWFESFPAMADARQAGPIGPGTMGRRYFVQKLINLPSPSIEYLRFHPMTGWTEFGLVTAKRIKWNVAGLRPATPQEIAANQASIDIVETNARVGREEKARADRDQALAESIATLDTAYKKADADALIASTAQVNRLDKAVSDESGARAQADANLIADYSYRDNQLLSTAMAGYNEAIRVAVGPDSAIATQVTSLTSTVGNHTTALRIYGESIDGIRGRYGVSVNATGAITGFELIGGGGQSAFVVQADRFLVQTSTGSKTPFEVNGSQVRLGVDLYAGNNKLIFDTGTVMMMMGVGFGTQNQFVIWLGPTRAANQCDEASGLFYFRVDGKGYYAGALNAGIKVNPRQTTSIAADASVTTGQFGSDGKSRVVTVSYGFLANEQIFNQCPANQPATYAEIELYRGVDASGVFITRQRFNGDYVCSDGHGQFEAGNRTAQISGSINYTDNTGGTQASYFARISSRSTPVFGSDTKQTLSVISVEQ